MMDIVFKIVLNLVGSFLISVVLNLGVYIFDIKIFTKNVARGSKEYKEMQKRYDLAGILS